MSRDLTSIPATHTNILLWNLVLNHEFLPSLQKILFLFILEVYFPAFMLSCSHFSFLSFKFYLFIYLWLCWVFDSVRGLSPAAASGGHSSSRCAGLSLSWPLLLRSTGSRRVGSAIVAHGPGRSAACGIFPDQGSNPYPLPWQADSQPLHHQGSPQGSPLQKFIFKPISIHFVILFICQLSDSLNLVIPLNINYLLVIDVNVIEKHKFSYFAHFYYIFGGAGSLLVRNSLKYSLSVFISFIFIYSLIPRMVDSSHLLSLQAFNPTITSLHS